MRGGGGEAGAERRGQRGEEWRGGGGEARRGEVGRGGSAEWWSEDQVEGEREKGGMGESG